MIQSNSNIHTMTEVRAGEQTAPLHLTLRLPGDSSATPPSTRSALTPSTVSAIYASMAPSLSTSSAAITSSGHVLGRPSHQPHLQAPEEEERVRNLLQRIIWLGSEFKREESAQKKQQETLKPKAQEIFAHMQIGSDVIRERLQQIQTARDQMSSRVDQTSQQIRQKVEALHQTITAQAGETAQIEKRDAEQQKKLASILKEGEELL